MTRGKSVSDEVKTTIRTMHAEGKTYNEIAKACNVSFSTVRNVVVLSPRPPSTTVKDTDLQTAIKQLELRPTKCSQDSGREECMNVKQHLKEVEDEITRTHAEIRDRCFSGCDVIGEDSDGNKCLGSDSSPVHLMLIQKRSKQFNQFVNAIYWYNRKLMDLRALRENLEAFEVTAHNTPLEGKGYDEMERDLWLNYKRN